MLLAIQYYEQLKIRYHVKCYLNSQKTHNNEKRHKRNLWEYVRCVYYLDCGDYIMGTSLVHNKLYTLSMCNLYTNYITMNYFVRKEHK